MTVHNPSYSIRGGRPGRERLRLLSRVLHESTSAFLDRLNLRPGQFALDLGCGGGDVTIEIAHRIAPDGWAIGVDVDGEQLRMAEREAEAAGLPNVRYVESDATTVLERSAFDAVYARFLLSHLPRPQDVLHAALSQLKPGGVIAIEDVDFSGAICWPPDAAVQRANELCADCMRAGGGDPSFGLRLPLLLRQVGFEAVQVRVTQCVCLEGEAKLLPVETVRNVVDAAIRHGLASAAEIRALVTELERHAARDETLVGTPRIVQAWARRPYETAWEDTFGLGQDTDAWRTLGPTMR